MSMPFTTAASRSGRRWAMPSVRRGPSPASFATEAAMRTAKSSLRAAKPQPIASRIRCFARSATAPGTWARPRPAVKSASCSEMKAMSSIHLGARRLDRLAPFHRFVLHELVHLVDRHDERLGARSEEALLELGLGQDLVHVAVQALDDDLGRLRGRGHRHPRHAGEAGIAAFGD